MPLIFAECIHLEEQEMSYRIAVFETKNDANGRPRSRLVGVLDEPVLSRYTLNRLILRRETELYRLRLLRDS